MPMIEVILNDRLGKKVRVKCNDDDTVGDLKKLVAAQVFCCPSFPHPTPCALLPEEKQQRPIDPTNCTALHHQGKLSPIFPSPPLPL